MNITCEVTTTDAHLATVTAARVKDGCDGIHTYKWEWGIKHRGHYLKMDEGELQHREEDGVLTLLGKIIAKIRGRGHVL